MGRPKQVHTSGAKRMRELGRVEVTLWLDPREHDLMIAAADGRPLATWIREQAYRAAEAAARDRLQASRRKARGE